MIFGIVGVMEVDVVAEELAWADSSMTEVLSEYDTPVAGDRAVTSALGTETMNHGTKTAFANLCRHQTGWRTSKLSLMLGTQAKAPRKPGRFRKFNRSEPQAATLVGLTFRTLPELAIGIARGFIASGISRTRSTCRSPFSRLAPLT